MRLAPVSSRAAANVVIAVVVLAGCARSTADQPAGGEPAPEAAPTGAVVTAEDIRQNPSQSLEEVIRSKCPPCAVTVMPDGRVAIQIRGQGTILGSSEPLYVIDGIPIEPGPGGALSGINPYDIETIEVLTEPTSLTMYGSRGANGVIVITTKQGPRRR
jgi:TonB-dependent SusC/RagA subfamily outer membrane receptor